MLGGAEIADVVAARARAGRLPNMVLDPVLIASSGRRLGTRAMIERLLPYAKVVTPNRDEASELVGWSVRSAEDMARAAEQIGSRGPSAVVVTGSGETPDVVWSGRGTWMVTGPRVDTYNDHGTGCAFSSAIAVRLAFGEQVAVAVEFAKRYVAGALTGGRDWKLGRGPGPLDHFGW
jgi:hydroxymethylpyrimidine/phosphomethylpyrimidine kinase